MKIVHVLSDVDQSHLIKTFGLSMDREKYDVGFVFLGRKKPLLHETFLDHGLKSDFLSFRGKRDYLSAFGRVAAKFRASRPDIVHTHLVDGSIVGLTAAMIARTGRRIHTRHHGVESHIYYPHGVYYDRYNNLLSERIIAISDVVSDVLVEREGVDPKKVITIPHGFDLENFKVDLSVTNELKSKYHLEGHFPVVGSIARFIHWKGVHNTVLGFARLLTKYPNAKLVLANAVGPYSDSINSLLAEHVPEKNFVKIEFEPQIFSLYPAFDVFVHGPVAKNLEAFGLVYIEPLTLKIPSVFTLSGVANNFISNENNALVVPYNDPTATAAAITRLIENKEMASRIAENGCRDVWRQFRADRMAADLDKLYTQLIS